MIDREVIANVIDVLEMQSVIYADREVNGYNYGSYFIPVDTRPSVSYLELYGFVLSHVLEIIDDGLNYANFGFTDDDIVYAINSVNELIFYYD
jgi:hypothetical protein